MKQADNIEAIWYINFRIKPLSTYFVDKEMKVSLLRKERNR